MTDLVTTIKNVLRDICLFSAHVSGVRLRSYQQAVAAAIADSVVHKRGLTFVVIFPRQSGKNELQAQIETYLLTLLQRTDAEIVKVSPTWKPQTLNAMRRLERILKRNLITRDQWKKEQSYIYRVGSARIFFLSGGPTANVVGATASTLLECDEAQDVLISKWDKEIAPMAASTNATRVFWGTAWTSQTLLAREKRTALEAQKKDGIQRVFELTADQVRTEVPAYGKFVDGEIARHGRNNPFIRTQYFSEEIDESTGMFTAERLALMQGFHIPYFSPKPDCLYTFTIDVGGEDFETLTLQGEGMGGGKDRDSTALTIFEIEQSTHHLDLQLGPVFKTVFRKQWTGASQVTVFRQISALVDLWHPYRIVIDATGVGEGLASFLIKLHRSIVIPFKFSQSSKSELGWKLLSAIESGRYKEYTPLAENVGQDLSCLQRIFWEQCKRTTFEILPGPGKICRWSVPEGARATQTGELIHDDLILSAALAAALLDDSWGTAESAIVPAYDPITEMSF